MARPPESTKTSLCQRLTARARERWPQLSGITVRYHGEFAYVAGQLPDCTILPLMRLRYAGSASTWGFPICRASHDDNDKSVLPSGYPAGTPRKSSTAPAASTSATLEPGSTRHPRRINGRGATTGAAGVPGSRPSCRSGGWLACVGGQRRGGPERSA
jgi:hypothetical protein